MHDALTIGVPVLAILAGILFNRSDVKDLRTEIKELRAEMRARFDQVDTRFNRVDADLRQFYAVTGKLEGRVDEISKK